MRGNWAEASFFFFFFAGLWEKKKELADVSPEHEFIQREGKKSTEQRSIRWQKADSITIIATRSGAATPKVGACDGVGRHSAPVQYGRQGGGGGVGGARASRWEAPELRGGWRQGVAGEGKKPATAEGQRGPPWVQLPMEKNACHCAEGKEKQTPMRGKWAEARFVLLLGKKKE